MRGESATGVVGPEYAQFVEIGTIDGNGNTRRDRVGVQERRISGARRADDCERDCVRVFATIGDAVDGDLRRRR